MTNLETSTTATKESLLQPKAPTSSEKALEKLRGSSVLLVGIAGLFLWHYGVIWSGVDDFILPGPIDVFAGLRMQLADPIFYSHLWVTTQEALAGFFIAAMIALSLGTAVSQIRVVEKTVMPYVAAIQTIPKVALAPLFVIWFGYGLSSKIVDQRY
jgi:NitT/TauT family transport system permease protein